MKLYLNLIAIAVGLVASSAQAQVDQLAFYSDALMNASKTEHRQYAFDKIEEIVDDVLAADSDMTTQFESLPWISVVSDTANSFRILTWQLSVGDSIFHYGGRMQHADGRITKLVEKKQYRGLEASILRQDNWYGARYYKIIPFNRDGKQAYILLGFNAHSKWNRRRVAEVLSFNEDGLPVFGMPIFVKPGEDIRRTAKSRLLLTYSRDSRVILDYDEQRDMLVHDHLVPIGERYPGQGTSFVSDASFEGYIRGENGLWEYRDRLFDQVQDSPPEDSTRLKPAQKRDILGRIITE